MHSLFWKCLYHIRRYLVQKYQDFTSFCTQTEHTMWDCSFTCLGNEAGFLVTKISVATTFWLGGFSI